MIDLAPPIRRVFLAYQGPAFTNLVRECGVGSETEAHVLADSRRLDRVELLKCGKAWSKTARRFYGLTPEQAGHWGDHPRLGFRRPLTPRLVMACVGWRSGDFQNEEMFFERRGIELTAEARANLACDRLLTTIARDERKRISDPTGLMRRHVDAGATLRRAAEAYTRGTSWATEHVVLVTARVHWETVRELLREAGVDPEEAAARLNASISAATGRAGDLH